MVKVYLTFLSYFIVPALFACGIFFSNEFSESPFTISKEETLILFDRDLKEEHFIRKIQVDGPQKEFGFLVPLPARPKVDEIKVDIFKVLDLEYEKQRPMENRYSVWGGEVDQSLGSRDGSRGMSKGGLGAASQVTVLEQKQLGQFKVSILRAEDARALKAWIDENAYKTKDEMMEYLNYYVQKKFFYVVFNFSPSSTHDETQKQTSQLIRLKFNTDEAFYPFKEPKGKINEKTANEEFFRKDRDLRLSIIQKGFAVKKLIEGEGISPNWESLEGKLLSTFHGNFTTRFASPIKYTHQTWTDLGFPIQGEKWTLTRFQYSHLHRPLSDLSFGSLDNYDAVLPPVKIVNHQIGVYLMIGLGLIILSIFWYFKKPKKCCN